AASLLELLHKLKNLTYGDLVSGAGQAIAAFRSAPRFDKPSLLQAGEDQLQEFLRDFLTFGDVGNLHRLAGRLESQVKNGVQGVLGFDRDIHPCDCRKPREALSSGERGIRRSRGRSQRIP